MKTHKMYMDMANERVNRHCEILNKYGAYYPNLEHKIHNVLWGTNYSKRRHRAIVRASKMVK